MPKRQLSAVGILLSKEGAGENHHRYLVFSSDRGLLCCLRRQSRRPARKPVPDLFDHAHLELEQASSGTVWFIRDYRVLSRSDGIAQNYRALLYASDFATLLKKNLIHTESFGNAFSLFSQALHFWNLRLHPEIVYFKTLYLYVRGEGYPVREDWRRRLPPGRRNAVSSLLQRPLQEQNGSLEETEDIIRCLKIWTSEKTDIILARAPALN